MSAQHVDVAVIGGGIAGIGVASELASAAKVVVLEREPHVGYHSTGRSAALFSEIYGNSVIRALSRASSGLFRSPSHSFTNDALIRPRGALFIALAGQSEKFAAWQDDVDVSRKTTRISPAAATSLVQILRDDAFEQAAFEPDAQDIEVETLLQAYARKLRAVGGAVLTGARISSISRQGDSWLIEGPDVAVRAGVLVNAAGAWADAVAQSAGARPLGICPYRRTAVLVDAPDKSDITRWPLVIDVGETVYFKPDASKLLISPADETADAATDVQPDEFDVAVAIDRFENLTHHRVRRVTHRWAGLRSFAPDRTPVAGFDSECPSFFWLAGQGGYGIQTAPALSRLAAALVLGQPVPSEIEDAGVDHNRLAPARLRTSAPAADLGV